MANSTKEKTKPAIDPVKLASNMNGESNEEVSGETLDIAVQFSGMVIELPDLQCFPGYATTNIDFNATKRQAAAAKVLWSTLAHNSERVSGARANHPEGKVVDSANDGVRWLLDQLADHIESRTGKALLEDFELVF